MSPTAGPLRTSLLSLVCALALSACGAMAEQPGRDNSIYHQVWQLRHSQQGNIGLTLNESRPSFTLHTSEDGSARGQVACNNWSAQARVGADLLRLERVVTRRSPCHISDRRVKALAGRYLNALQAATAFQIEDGQLRLRLQNGETWLFERRSGSEIR